jgi:hypothetical protein
VTRDGVGEVVGDSLQVGVRRTAMKRTARSVTSPTEELAKVVCDATSRRAKQRDCHPRCPGPNSPVPLQGPPQQPISPRRAWPPRNICRSGFPIRRLARGIACIHYTPWTLILPALSNTNCVDPRHDFSDKFDVDKLGQVLSSQGVPDAPAGSDVGMCAAFASRDSCSVGLRPLEVTSSA